MITKYRAFLFIFCFLISVIFISPQMRFTYPNFIDVVETWMLGTQMVQNTIGEFSNQMRFWPALKFERSILNVVFGGHPEAYFFYFSMLLATTVYALCSIPYKKQLGIVFCGLVFVFVYISPVTVDTYWRLGAAETVFTLFLVSSIYTLMVEKYAVTVLFAIGLMATKESAVFYVPIYMGFFLFRKRYGEFVILGILYIGFLVKLYMLVQYAIAHTVYTTMLTTTIQGFISMVNHIVSFHGFYMMALWITMALFMYRVLVVPRKNVQRLIEYGYVFFALNIAGLCALLSFRNTFQSYYAFPWMMTVLVWCIWELQSTAPYIARGVIAILLFLFFVMRIPEQTKWKMEYWQNDYAGDNALIAYVFKNKSVRYVFMREYRPEYSIGLNYLLGDRSKTMYTDTIFLTEKERKYPADQLLCAPTMFQSRYCKWGIIRHE